jgi:hypothetical protein
MQTYWFIVYVRCRAEELAKSIADRATHVASFRKIATSPSRVSRQGKVSILALRDSGIARLDYLFLEPAGAM